jgi:hypothetical protein
MTARPPLSFLRYSGARRSSPRVLLVTTVDWGVVPVQSIRKATDEGGWAVRARYLMGTVLRTWCTEYKKYIHPYSTIIHSLPQRIKIYSVSTHLPPLFNPLQV